jgi:hypothetical protein
MQFPAAFYGQFKEVKPRAGKIVTQLKRGTAWPEAALANGMVDSGAVPGLFVLNGPSPLLGGDPHFQCFLALFSVRQASFDGRLPSEMEDEVFAQALVSAWGTLSALAPANVGWISPERFRPVLLAALKFWDVFEAEGDRYTVGSNTGQSLWAVPNNVKYVLSNMGVGTPDLKAPLPPRGLAGLLDHIDRLP